MARKYEVIPRTLDPSPYYFDVFWQAVTKANKARTTLRKIYQQTHPNGEYIAPFSQAEQVNVSTDSQDLIVNQDQSNPSHNGQFAIAHIKVIGRTINAKPDQLTADSNINL